ncbi:MAG: hypothetical protein P0S94_01235, partial [Simkaniaceae bacterium]|nr:hypothetical protein [Simkaniaceae bacterium]
MSVILPVLSAPLVFSFLTYIAATEAAPRKDFNPCPSLTNEAQPFFEEHDIRRDIVVIEEVNQGFCRAAGSTLFSKNPPGIHMAPGLHNEDKNAYNWILKHEIHHIKSNDLFTIPLVACIASIAFGIIGIFLLPTGLISVVAYFGGITAMSLFSQWREAAADNFAIENSSIEELLGGRRLLTAFQNTQLEKR